MIPQYYSHTYTHTHIEITDIRVSVLTGDRQGAGTDDNHKIQLNLNDGTEIDAELPEMTAGEYNEAIEIAISGFNNTDTDCIEKDEINGIWIISCGNDGWFIESIVTEFILSCGTTCRGSVNLNANRWIDDDGARKFKLNYP